jgi:hypothetical protein
MFRFTIRDVLWLTVVVAVFAAWWLDHRQLRRDARATWELVVSAERGETNRLAKEVIHRYAESLDKASNDGKWPSEEAQGSKLNYP